MLHLHPRPRLRLAAMSTLAVVSLARMTSYLVPSAPDNPLRLAFIGPFIPDGWHAAPWALVALLALVTIVKNNLEPYTVGAFVGLNVLWGASMIASSIVLPEPRGWVSAVSYIALGILTGILFGMVDPADARGMREQRTRQERQGDGDTE